MDENNVEETLELSNDTAELEPSVEETQAVTEVESKEDNNKDDAATKDQEEKQEEKTGAEEPPKKILFKSTRTVKDEKTGEERVEEVDNEIDENTVFTHIVDGEEKQITIKEALNRASGDVAIEKRFNDFNAEKKKWEAEKGEWQKERDEVDAQLTNILKKFGQDPIEGIVYMGELANLDPIEFRSFIDQKMNERYSKYASMTDEEREIARLKEQNEFITRYTKSKSEEVNQKQAQEELKVKVNQLRETYDVSEDEYNQAIEFVNNSKDEQVKALVKDPEKLMQEIVNYKKETLAVEALKLINPKYAEKAGFIYDASKLVEKGDTVEALVEKIKADLGLKSEEDVRKENNKTSVNRKIEKNSKVANVTSKQTNAVNKEADKDFIEGIKGSRPDMSFDELEDLLLRG